MGIHDNIILKEKGPLFEKYEKPLKIIIMKFYHSRNLKEDANCNVIFKVYNCLIIWMLSEDFLA